MNITEYTVEKIKDPTGILIGDRYEFFLDLDVDEEDDLSLEENIQLKVLFFFEEDESKILNYHFYNSITDKYLDFALEDDEFEDVLTFCKAHYMEAE